MAKERQMMLLTNMHHFIELGESVANVNKALVTMEERRNQTKIVRERKKKMMEENKELVTGINNLMANEERA